MSTCARLYEVCGNKQTTVRTTGRTESTELGYTMNTVSVRMRILHEVLIPTHGEFAEDLHSGFEVPLSTSLLWFIIVPCS